LEKYPEDSGLGNALQSMGDAERLDNRAVQARALYERALAAYQRAGDKRGQGTALTALADVEYRLDQYGPARDLYERADNMLGQQGDILGQVYAQLGLALVSLAENRTQEFDTHLEHARELARQQGSPAVMDEVARIERQARDSSRAARPAERT
jgi:tetratricopeptide (TPR) repeat protein